ncbi:hypothetical protein ACUY3K_00815 [Corynebacterium uberis]|uniref:hypothetical protein n=1 Tax=Corynebacterium TaxID=1716 RepID=UPI001D0A7A7B|nr:MULTISPECIES: hypothetical protein [Corynebacterium]MCZ9309027.1 hypothetical protein [Corynebacterium sp. c6VSa_13]UDL74506.1 hypothetical protein LH391_04760 [Corynebacterium uberis]UDL76659.1 hypothetical protein LH393_04635 [Corynebacterium uberis]UDL78872.1 hypothetical protein LH394_04625 [Corynebacterium uberis]UDL81150.1 hypothetical protein LH392_05045 [Corynebacterium uberis]
MYPLHSDITLDAAGRQRALDYLVEVDFHLPGSTPRDFRVKDLARYIGWNFQSEDLEAYAVGLVCTTPGLEAHHTFIRMSYGQLTGQPDALRLPVNQPVLANQTLRMQRWRDTPTGPSRTGVDSYATADGSVPGVDLDLAMLHDTLADALDFAHAGHSSADEGQFDLAVDLGTLLAGRYPRLKYYEKAGRLTAPQQERLRAFEAQATQAQQTLESLELPTLARIAVPEKRRHAQHHS